MSNGGNPTLHHPDVSVTAPVHLSGSCGAHPQGGVCRLDPPFGGSWATTCQPDPRAAPSMDGKACCVATPDAGAFRSGYAIRYGEATAAQPYSSGSWRTWDNGHEPGRFVHIGADFVNAHDFTPRLPGTREAKRRHPAQKGKKGEDRIRQPLLFEADRAGDRCNQVTGRPQGRGPGHDGQGGAKLPGAKPSRNRSTPARRAPGKRSVSS